MFVDIKFVVNLLSILLRFGSLFLLLILKLFQWFFLVNTNLYFVPTNFYHMIMCHMCKRDKSSYVSLPFYHFFLEHSNKNDSKKYFKNHYIIMFRSQVLKFWPKIWHLLKNSSHFISHFIVLK
jgi:hypothetical protein